MTAVQGWGDLASKDCSYLIDSLKLDPSANVEDLYEHLNDKEKRIDQVLGTHLYSMANAPEIKRSGLSC